VWARGFWAEGEGVVGHEFHVDRVLFVVGVLFLTVVIPRDDAIARVEVFDLGVEELRRSEQPITKDEHLTHRPQPDIFEPETRIVNIEIKHKHDTPRNSKPRNRTTPTQHHDKQTCTEQRIHTTRDQTRANHRTTIAARNQLTHDHTTILRALTTYTTITTRTCPTFAEHTKINTIFELCNNVFIGGVFGVCFAMMVDGADVFIGGSHNYFSDVIELVIFTGFPVELVDNLTGVDFGFVLFVGFDL